MNADSTYPVIIVVTDNSKSAIMLDDYDELKFTFPDSEYIYFSNTYNDLRSYSLLTGQTNNIEFDDIEKQQRKVLKYYNTK